MHWTTVPPWFYKSDISDVELQRATTEAARRRALGLVKRLQDMEQEMAELRAETEQAVSFYEEAQASLRGYEAAAQPAASVQPEAEDAAFLPAPPKALPKP
jgi:hypothetical protein